MSDVVRMQRYYEGESYQTEDRDGYTNGMPEILERWCVEEITRNGWITLVQERRPEYARDLRGKRRYGALFEETGERIKLRKGSDTQFLLAVHSSLANDELSMGRDRWERLGCTPRPEEYRMPVLGVA
ncbi:hypothetical protein ACGF8D_10540 [Streptomyces massasporeus]|uniref:hypothetical protein n=1 Tax=Streptomyces massasporeus TaxID=67324 RepID=UPI003713CF3C